MRDGKHVILCVDDDPDILTALRIVLEARGYVVVEAATAAEALEVWEREQPDLVIIDLMMEEIDSGMTLARTLKARGSTAPMFFLSSAGDYMHGAVDLGEVGASGVFQKPLQPDVLLRLIEHRLKAVPA